MTPTPRSGISTPEKIAPARAVTREMIHARTSELAVLAGRLPLQITQGDYERARRELTGESDVDRQEAVLNASQAPAPGTTDASGPRAPAASHDPRREN